MFSRFARSGALVPLVVLAACGSSGSSNASRAHSNDAVNKTSSTTIPRPLAPLDSSGSLTNGGFEDALTGWSRIPQTNPAQPDPLAHSGAGSALARLAFDTTLEGGTSTVLAQDIGTRQVPKTLSGWYRVDGWKRGSNVQYVGLVLAAVGGKHSPLPTSTNVQIHYMLGGIGAQPFGIGNAKFVFVDKADPKSNTWTRFEVHPSADFRRTWKSVPSALKYLRLILVTRVMNHHTGDAPGAADVRWDDIALSY